MAYGETNLTFVATLTTLLFCSLYIHSQVQTSAAAPMYDYDQQSDWRPAPRPVTQPRPYQRPAPQVHYPKPSQKPTAAPKKAQKAAPVASCLDDASWYYGMDKTKNCAHVAEKPQKRCQTSDGTRTGLEACPQSCGVPCSVSYAPTSVAEFSHKPSMRPTRKPHAFIRYDDDDAIVEEDPASFPWWRLTFGIVVLGGLAWVFTKSTLDGAYDRLSRTVPLPGAVFGSSSSEYERV